MVHRQTYQSCYLSMYVVNAAPVCTQNPMTCSEYIAIERCERDKNFEAEGSCSNINIAFIGNFHLFFDLFLWNIVVHELLFQAEYFPSKSGQPRSENSFPPKKKCLEICYTLYPVEALVCKQRSSA